MKEIDTETSVIWPSWCYSDKINCNVIKECAEIEKAFALNVDKSSNYTCLQDPKPTIPPSATARATLSLPTNTIVGEKKMLSERSLLLSGYINSNTTDSAITNCDISDISPLAGIPLTAQTTALTITPTTTAAAAAAYLYLEKVKNERMSPHVTASQLGSLKDVIMESSAAAAIAAAMANNNNSISLNNNNNNSSNIHSNNNNNNNNSSGSGSASNCSNSSSGTSNTLVSSQAQKQNANNSIHCSSDELHSQNQSLAQSCNQPHQHQLNKASQHHHQQHQQQQQLSLQMNSNHVKKERLSPGTNGDNQTTLSRSRSTTPSSFRGTSPQNSVHGSPSDTIGQMHNIPANLLSSIHQVAAATSRHGNLGGSSSCIANTSPGLPTDFSTRNYSDFMRSLAAKYNNTNPNDNNLKRNTMFEATSSNTTALKKTSAAAQKTSYASTPSTPLNKEITITTTSSLPPPPPLTAVPISPGESAVKLSQQNKLAAAVANAAAACSGNVSPYMTSFLSTLPFSPGIFPPLIDMSSTQALITLARAAKENEIQKILSASQQHPKRSRTSTSPSPSPSLTMALQQAAQFISPTLIYSAQLQKQQQQQESQVSRQSSPRLANISNSTSSSTASAKSCRNVGEKTNVSPLDLSSQPPPSKRFKGESISSQSSPDNRMHTTTSRRASSSTATTSPSPPPLNETPFKASANAAPTPTSTVAVIGSSSKTEATSTAFTPIKVVSSTSTTSAIAPAPTVRQCQAQSEELTSWTVNDVCAFVGSIDICAEYAKHFRDQCIDGSGLPLLTEDHLVNSLGMKLGPALKLRSVLAKKLGGPCPCVSCVAQVQQVLALQTSGLAATPTTASSEHAIGNNTTNVPATCGNTQNSSTCNSYLPKNSLSGNSSMNCSNYKSTSTSNRSKNESTRATTSSTNTISTISTTTSVCNSEANSALPPSPAAISQQQQQQQALSPSQAVCCSNYTDPSTSRHDNADSSS